MWGIRRKNKINKKSDDNGTPVLNEEYVTKQLLNAKEQQFEDNLNGLSNDNDFSVSFPVFILMLSTFQRIVACYPYEIEITDKQLRKSEINDIINKVLYCALVYGSSMLVNDRNGQFYVYGIISADYSSKILTGDDKTKRINVSGVVGFDLNEFILNKEIEIPKKGKKVTHEKDDICFFNFRNDKLSFYMWGWNFCKIEEWLLPLAIVNTPKASSNKIAFNCKTLHSGLLQRLSKDILNPNKSVIGLNYSNLEEVAAFDNYNFQMGNKASLELYDMVHNIINRYTGEGASKFSKKERENIYESKDENREGENIRDEYVKNLKNCFDDLNNLDWGFKINYIEREVKDEQTSNGNLNLESTQTRI